MGIEEHDANWGPLGLLVLTKENGDHWDRLGPSRLI